jgi:hypothetical protein
MAAGADSPVDDRTGIIVKESCSIGGSQEIHDGQERKPVMAQLRTRCGPDGAHFIVGLGDPSPAPEFSEGESIVDEECRTEETT